MPSDNNIEHKIVADQIVSPDDDIVIAVNGAVYMNSISEGNKLATIADVGNGGGGGDIADFVFTNEGEGDSSTVTISNKDMIIQTLRDDAETDADVNIEAADDVFITSNGDSISLLAFNTVRVETGSGTTWEFGNGGGLDLPGNGNIYNPTNSSGDGLGLSTLELQPDLSITNDRYIVIDPTEPDHIHIRAGGAIDASNAKLYLGGEQAHVNVVDSDHEVFVRTTGPLPVVSLVNNNETSPSNFLVTTTANNVSTGWVVYDDPAKTGSMATVTGVTTEGTPFTEYSITVDTADFFTNGLTYYFFDENQTVQWDWTFGEDGYLYGPAMGLIKATGLINEDNTGFLGLAASNHVLLAGGNGVFLNDASVAGNQVATVSDLPTGATGTFTSADGKTITVTDGIITAITP